MGDTPVILDLLTFLTFVFAGVGVVTTWRRVRAHWVRALARFWVHVGAGFDRLRHRSTAGLPPGFGEVNRRPEPVSRYRPPCPCYDYENPYEAPVHTWACGRRRDA